MVKPPADIASYVYIRHFFYRPPAEFGKVKRMGETAVRSSICDKLVLVSPIFGKIKPWRTQQPTSVEDKISYVLQVTFIYTIH